MADLSSGTRFGKFEANKSMRLSNKDIVLIIGIVVAVIITVTTVVYREHLFASAREMLAPRKTSMSSTAQQFIEFIGKHSNVKHSRSPF